MARFVIEEDEGAAPIKGRFVIEDDAPAEPFGKRLNREIADIPRQVGLTARHGLKGLGSAVGIFADPVGGLINAATGSHLLTAGGLADRIADNIGLPKPASATERVVGDATELMASVGPIAKGSQIAAKTVQGAPQKLLETLAARPGTQAASAGASGGAGGYTRETGGNEGSQLAAALAAGVGVPMLATKAQQLGTKAANAITRTMKPAQLQQVDVQINRALQGSGLTMADLPVNVQNGIRSDVQAALKADGLLSSDAVRRLADYRLTGATPTAATLTLDPAMVSQQKNLAKLGINSKDKAAQQLGQLENQNNRQLIANLNDLGAATADDVYAGGQKIIGALQNRNEAAKSIIGARYDAARASSGRSAAIDHVAFTNQANNLLDDALLGGKLPGDVRNLLNSVAEGKTPLTVDVAEQFKTRIGDLQRATTDMAERKALGLVRQSLDNAPLLDGQGQQAVDAFNKARRLNRAWMGIVEKTPALQAVRDGVEPDKFVQQFIIGGSKSNVADVAALRRSVKDSPEAMQAVRGQIARHLKQSALGGAADEVGNFSQSNYNKALNAIGERKLSMFFTKEELAQMKAVGRVASYEQFQPRGAAVNNSNTAGTAVATLLDRVGNSPLLSKLPMGNLLAEPAVNISVGMQAKNVLNVPGALTTTARPIPYRQPPAGLLMSPAMFMTPDEERRGLLAP